MRTPTLALHQALAREIKRLGYSSMWNMDTSAEAVLIDQLHLTNRREVRDMQDYEVTFVLDVISRSKSPIRAYQMVENIRAHLNIEIPGYIIQDFALEECSGIEEQDDQGIIFRQIQRCRIKLT